MIRLLAAGCDTLYWSARVDVTDAVLRLGATKEQAIAAGAPQPWDAPSGFAFVVLPHGVNGYPVILECAELRIQLTASRYRPGLYVELRSEFIHEVGLEGAIAESAAVAEELVGRSVGEPHVSRIDLYADYAGFPLTHAEYVGFVCQAKRYPVASNTNEYETLRFGKSPFLVRVYAKDIERREAGKPRLVTWDGYDGPVTRVEVQASSTFLRDLHVGTLAEVLAARGDIWRHATHTFLRLHHVGRAERERWALRDEWRVVQGTGIDHFPASGVVPFREVQGSRLRCLRQVRGYLTSLAALEGVSELRALLVRLPGLLELLPPRSESDADEIAHKRRRLPRAVLALRNVEPGLAFALGQPPAPGREPHCEPFQVDQDGS